ncbi:MAG: IS1595 family transposase [Desulfovibrionales bacterium]|nr:IS1595 family transposase [Desulfovibrionales bacterium]
MQDLAAFDTTMLDSEDAALDYLLSYCWPSGVRFCPRCGQHKLYTLSGGRYRCAMCKYTFQDFSGRWINNGSLSPTTWLKLTHLFLHEYTVHELAQEVNLSYNAAYKAITTIRFALLAHATDAQQLLGAETGLGKYIKGKKLTGAPPARAKGAIPVFGIMERNGWVFIDLVSNIEAETVFHFNHSFHLTLFRAGNIIYTGKYRQYDALILCGDDSLPYEYIRKYDHEFPIQDGSFWDFASSRLKRFKGITPQRFPLYLKELEFRYNNRKSDMLSLLLTQLCDLVPDFDPFHT